MRRLRRLMLEARLAVRRILTGRHPVTAETPPVFLLGVGAQKAGTSWLHDYIASHPDCYLEPIKEYHVFDVAYQPQNYGRKQIGHLRQIRELLVEKIDNHDQRNRKMDRALRGPMIRIMMRIDPEVYVDRFLRLVRKNPQARVFGDITPSYASLGARNFASIRKLFDDTPFDMRVVFIMRDPIERIFSAMKHDDRDILAKKGITPELSSVERFRTEFAENKHAIRSGYFKTIRALESTFPPEQIHVMLYEEMFSEPAIKELCGFLGISYVEPNFEKRVNASPSDETLDPADIAVARAHFENEYRFAFKRFGEDRIKAIWKHA